MARLKYMHLNVLLLKYLSVYPTEKSMNIIVRLFYYLWRLVCVFSQTILIVTCGLDIWAKEKVDLSGMAFNLIYLDLYTGSISQVLYILARPKKTKEIIETINSNFKDNTDPSVETLYMKSWKKIADYVTMIWAFATILAGQFNAIGPLIKADRSLLVSAWFPFKWKQTPYYQMIFFSQCVAQFFMCFTYAGSDSMYAATCALTAGQFKILGGNVKNALYTALIEFGVEQKKVDIFSMDYDRHEIDSNSDIEYLKQKEQVKAEINEILNTSAFKNVLNDVIIRNIKFHQMLIKFVDVLENYFTPLLLIKVTFNTFCIIFMGFCAIASQDSTFIMVSIENGVTAIGQLYLFTFFGNMLTYQSAELHKVIYEGPWYICDQNYKKSLLFMKMCCANPVKLTAGKFINLNLNNFLSIMRTCASYITVMRQVMNMKADQQQT